MAPPPKPAPPRGTAAAQPRHSPMLKWIALVILGIIVVLGLVVLIIWLVVHPRELKYSIESGSISGYNLTNDHLTANFLFVLRANNPNRRMSFYYDRIDVTVLYEDQKLSVNNVHPFYQPKRNITYLDLPLVAKNAALFGAVTHDMSKERASGDIVLDVKIRAKIRVKVGVFKIRRTLRAFCGSVTVPFYSSSYHQSFKRVTCDVDH